MSNDMSRRKSRIPFAVVDAGRDVLGESPVWSTDEQVLYWVDIRRKLLRRFDPATGQVEQWDTADTVGSVALRASGGVILALSSGICAHTPATGLVTLFPFPQGEPESQRFNDGRCDPRGRFWIGTMSDVARVPTGSLYRIDPDLACTRFLDGITVPNSLCWNREGTRMYFADTVKQTIYVFDYAPDTGMPTNQRIFATTSGREGRPDGSTVDAEGYLWNADFFGWSVTRYAPDGSIDRIIELPVQCPTSCAFGGPSLETLFVTTARHLLTPEQAEQQPLAGALLALDVGVRGVAEPAFAG